MSRPVRVRFAPSPTGPLHIGGVRTALFNYLFAKKHNGSFVLRVEDTDQTRLIQGAEQYIIEALKWSGIEPLEGVGFGDGKYGPYKQSERKHLYAKYAHKLIETGHAYYVFDTQEELEALRKNSEKGDFVYGPKSRMELNNSLTMSEAEVAEKLSSGENFPIRFKMPESRTIKFSDEIRGAVSMESDLLDDKVLFKTDGMPTYHLANIVDDHLMEISHVIRGEEWLPSAPLHVMLYEAFGWEAPKFAHLPLILKPNGNGKLSKRDGVAGGFPVFPLEYNDVAKNEISSGFREEGYMQDAFLNMLFLLGYGAENDQEIFSKKEMIEAFDLGRVVKSGAKFNPEKAKWYNEQYLRELSDTQLAKVAQPFFLKAGYHATEDTLLDIVSLLKERVSFAKELPLAAKYFFESPSEYDAKTVKKKWKENTPKIIDDLLTDFKKVEESEWNAPNLENKFQYYLQKHEMGFGQAGPGLRLVLTGLGGGPGLFDIMEILGKPQCEQRISSGLANLA